VHVVQLLALFVGTPDVEIVEARLPELLGRALRLPFYLSQFTGSERFLPTQADPFAGSEWGRKSRLAPLGMTGCLAERLEWALGLAPA
jgi:hypothetical protein